MSLHGASFPRHPMARLSHVTPWRAAQWGLRAVGKDCGDPQGDGTPLGGMP